MRNKADRAAARPTRRALLRLSAFLAALPGTAIAADRPEPALAFLNAIYDRYRRNGAGVALGEPAVLARYFTPDLAGLIAADDARAAAAGEVPNLDADPFIDAQDGEIRAISVTVSPAPGGHMTGHVRFANSGEAKAISLDLVETGDGWRIDDIHWPEGTLRDLYAR